MDRHSVQLNAGNALMSEIASNPKYDALSDELLKYEHDLKQALNVNGSRPSKPPLCGSNSSRVVGSEAIDRALRPSKPPLRLKKPVRTIRSHPLLRLFVRLPANIVNDQYLPQRTREIVIWSQGDVEQEVARCCKEDEQERYHQEIKQGIM